MDVEHGCLEPGLGAAPGGRVEQLARGEEQAWPQAAPARFGRTEKIAREAVTGIDSEALHRRQDLGNRAVDGKGPAPTVPPHLAGFLE
jgi:hypothetical protein